MIKHRRSQDIIGRQRTERITPLKRFAFWKRSARSMFQPVAGSVVIPRSEGGRMKTLLLVDHNIEHLVRHGDILGRAGYRIVTAQDGKSALFILESGMPLDLIVTEYALPDMGPGEILAAFRNQMPAVPVIVVTDCDSVDSYIHAIDLGAYDYLNKPLLPGELRGIVRTAADARQSGRLPAGMA